MASTNLRIQRVLTPADLADRHLMLPLPPSRVLSTVMDRFSASGVAPTRVSTCNSFTVSMQAIVRGLAIGVLPKRIMEDEIARGAVRQLTVAPALPSNWVSICHQTGHRGPGLEEMVALMRDLISEHRVFD
jgi:DNA-binding transcriptional LysR family regulator